MIKFNKILNILLLTLIGITLLLLILFFFGGEVEGASLYTPLFTDSLLNWGFILVALAAGVTVFFEVANIILQPQKAKRTLMSIGILLLIILISYILADGTPLHLYGYTGSDNVPYWLVYSDIFLFTSYIAFGITIAALLFTEVSRAFRKG